MATRYDVLALCVSRAGIRNGARVGQFIAAWELVVRHQGGPILQQDYTAYWKQSRHTTMREVAAFRAAFPELGAQGLPQDLMRPLLDDLAQGRDVAPVYPLAVTA